MPVAYVRVETRGAEALAEEISSLADRVIPVLEKVTGADPDGWITRDTQ